MPHINAFLDMVTRLSQAFINLSSETKASILIIAGLLGAAGPIAMAVAALMPVIASITGPVALVAAAVGALAYAIVTNFEAVEPIIIGFANSVIKLQNKTKILTAVWEGLKVAMVVIIESIKTVFMQTLSFISGVIDAVVLLLDGEFSQAGERMLSAFGEMDQQAQQSGEVIGQAILDGISNTMETEDMELIPDGAISSAVDGLILSIKTGMNGADPIPVKVEPVIASEETEDPGPTTFSPMADFFTDDMVNAADERVTKMVNTMQMVKEQFEQVGGAFKDAFGSAFDAILDNGDNMKEQLTNIGRDLMKNLMKIAIGNAIAAAFSPLSADNAATGGLAGIMKSSLLQGLIPGMMPKLARGGLAFGPTIAQVGDNVGASVDPEVIAPLSKLKGMMGGGNMTATISGRDIRLTSARDANRSRRTYGSYSFN
jgi:hypothetical protein